jgi:hypothetical protein
MIRMERSIYPFDEQIRATLLARTKSRVWSTDNRFQATQSKREKLSMPRGASPKREHEYKELKSEFKKEGRYPGREEEVASRIVNKQRAQHGETKKSDKKEKAKS